MDVEKEKFTGLKYLNLPERTPMMPSLYSQYELEIVKKMINIEKKLDIILKKLEDLENELKKKGIL